jgi:hypothetical protein
VPEPEAAPLLLAPVVPLLLPLVPPLLLVVVVVVTALEAPPSSTPTLCSMHCRLAVAPLGGVFDPKTMACGQLPAAAPVT